MKASRAEAPPAGPFEGDKILGHMDRVRDWLASGRSRPITLEFDLTNLCSHRCPACFGFHPARDAAQIPLEDARRILRQARDFGVRGLTFTGGGEPLMNPAAPQAVEHARSLGFDVGFITNGTALTEETARTLLRCCQWVRVSLDAGGPRAFRLSHGLDERGFERTLAAVRLLARLKREEKHPCTLGLGYLTSGRAGGDLLAFARLGRELGVDYVQFRPLLRRPGEPEPPPPGEDVLAEMRRASELSSGAFRVLHSEHKYRLIRAGDLRRRYRKCYGQHFAAVVAADQKMYACCHLRGLARYRLGDLSRQTFAEVWDSPRRRSVAASVDFKDCPLLCRCDAFNALLWDIKHEGRPAEDDGRAREHPNFI